MIDFEELARRDQQRRRVSRIVLVISLVIGVVGASAFVAVQDQISKVGAANLEVVPNTTTQQPAFREVCRDTAERCNNHSFLIVAGVATAVGFGTALVAGVVLVRSR